MAFPLLLPLLFMGGSIAANTIGAKQQSKAMSAQRDAMRSRQEAERVRQQALTDESFAVNEQSLDRFRDFDGQKAERSTKLADQYAEAASSAPTTSIPSAPPSSSNLVVASDAKANAAAQGSINQRSGAMGSMESFADLFGGLERMGMRDSSQLGMLGGFRRGSQGVLPMELQAEQNDVAMHKGGGMRMLGDILNMGSSMTLPGALTAGGGDGLAGMFGGGGVQTSPLYGARNAIGGPFGAAGQGGFALPSLY